MFGSSRVAYERTVEFVNAARGNFWAKIFRPRQ